MADKQSREVGTTEKVGMEKAGVAMEEGARIMHDTFRKRNELHEVIGDKPSFTDGLNPKNEGVKMKPTDRAATRPEQPTPTTSRSIGSLHVDIDCADALKGLKAVQREARKASKELKEVESLTKDKLLVIEVEELGDAPNVFYKGEKILLKESIDFHWLTRTEIEGVTEFKVNYFDKETKLGKTIKERRFTP